MSAIQEGKQFSYLVGEVSVDISFFIFEKPCEISGHAGRSEDGACLRL
jgi:hypothetical protein